MMKLVKPTELEKTPIDETERNRKQEENKQNIQTVNDSFSVDTNNLFQNSSDLKNAHSDFEKFIQAVSADLLIKIDCLKFIKSKEDTTWNDASYARVQLFMLSQYRHRVNRFREVSRNSLENICNKTANDNQVTTLVAKHIDILARLKRRLKHILDVSEKYAVEDLFSKINLLKEMSDEMDNPTQNHNEGKESRRRYKSLISLQKMIIQDTTEAKTSIEREKSVEKEIILAKKQKVKTWRSLTDHLTVLTKTYTNRR
eukprot:GFUD01004149.1.p1 GENE.GFUD01004149.1~~GFUD01004149.1.p1  ORF type:complete len:257 (+),score=93.13 GFUD01004149.1:112-882(+)